ncbi:hypothetical protein [Extensimonas vulgaris]|uniref:hypothetical protein n=1 Tax=Extensimonas vulgaris TaxID=1031594 RepID=UPI0011C025EB|nr:hypothetical protein [Extensimonas vulgaris]TXD15556.1 hypothetical protein FUT63_06390 [Extensimonas vulgaris]
MGQEAGKKWAAAAHSQPTIPKSDRLLVQRLETASGQFIKSRRRSLADQTMLPINATSRASHECRP